MKEKQVFVKSTYKRRDNITGYLMLSPWLFGFAFMWLIPMFISIYYSFTDFNLLNEPKIIGVANYVRIFTQDDTFYQALKVTFLYVIILVPLRLAFALLNSYTNIRIRIQKSGRCPFHRRLLQNSRLCLFV